MKPKWIYPTAFSLWGDEEREAMLRVIESGWFTQGEEVAAFEREFAAYHGMAHGIMVNSGSSANLIAVAALMHLGAIKAGDVALVPAIAWSTTYAPLVQYGLNLLLMDVGDDWNADVYNPRFDAQDARVVVGCSILGIPAPLPTLKSAATVLGDPLIEDNCESLGATIDGKLCGTFGFLNTFSFFHSHQISAIEGGMILTDDEDAARACRMLRAHGWTRDLGDPPAKFEAEYDFQGFGYNVRGLEMHAAIGRAQLRRLDGMIHARQRNLALFRDLAADLIDRGAVLMPEVPAGCTASPFGIAFEVTGGQEARRGLAHALRAKGIDCRLPTGGSFLRHPYARRWASQETPRADLVHSRGMFIGNAPFAIPSLIEEAVAVMEGALL